jgi:hypothetical protein
MSVKTSTVATTITPASVAVVANEIKGLDMSVEYAAFPTAQTLIALGVGYPGSVNPGSSKRSMAKRKARHDAKFKPGWSGTGRSL